MKKNSSRKVVRSCLVCRKKFEQHQLQRFTWQDGEVKADETEKRTGRGVYCCSSEFCRGKFMKSRRKLEKAFRV